MLFETDPDRLESPRRPGYPHYTVDVVSPELPCGAAWLATALLELRVPLWQPWGIDDRAAWSALPDGRWLYRFAGSGWRRLVPGLVDGRIMRLRRRPVPRFTHAWPGQLQAAPRLILIVRDPRDALHSGWQRAVRIDPQRNASGFIEYLRSPFHHLPLDHAGYAWMFWRSWLRAAQQRPCLILRFEDFKADPNRWLQRTLDFLGIGIPARQRAHACRAAHHAVVAAADRELAAAGIGPRLLGEGRVEQWRSKFSVQMHGALGTRFDSLFEAFGYPPRSAPNATNPRDDIPDAHRLAVAITGSESAGYALLPWLQAALDDNG